MAAFVFRNHTVEAFWGDDGVAYSGYGDISLVPRDADRYIWFYQVPVNVDSATLAREIDSYRNQLDLVLEAADDRKPFIVFSLVNLFPVRLTGDDWAVAEAIAAFNSHIAALAQARPNVKWVDFSEFTSCYDMATLVNWKFYLMSQALPSPKLARDFKLWWQRIEGELALKRKKCLVLDLDNTLWGGVLGEDGIDGIALGGDYPGKAFAWWQQALLQLQQRGVILAVCSKNNEADVTEAWDKNPFMVLKREHFSAVRINWNDKAANMRELAQELNIGLDSMVFIDDNPAERQLISTMLPEVEVPEFPEKPYLLMPFFKQLVDRYFRVYAVTDEDRAKTEQYRANALRNEQRTRFEDYEDYLRSLSMELDIIPANGHNLARIAQMTQKTNQFNLTTMRYSEDDLRFQLSNHWRIYCLSVKDCFGDNGITGAITVIPQGGQLAEISSLLMSCRILGRGIETAFVNAVINRLYSEGVSKVTARYLPTAKNGQTADFWDRVGMRTTSVASGGEKNYVLKLYQPLDIKEYYKINWQQ